MEYQFIKIPYNYWSRPLTVGESKIGLDKLVDEIPERTRIFGEYLQCRKGYLFTPETQDQNLDALPDFIAFEADLVKLTEENISERFQGLSFEKPVANRLVISNEALDINGLKLVFDGGLLWGEAFRLRYPLAQWSLCRTPYSSVDYGQPVLVIPGMERVHFNPVRELHAHVGRILLGRSNHPWTLSRIMKMRAYEFGLGPDPRV